LKETAALPVEDADDPLAVRLLDPDPPDDPFDEPELPLLLLRVATAKPLLMVAVVWQLLDAGVKATVEGVTVSPTVYDTVAPELSV
jgi:hypothetical protein